ncbi:hypothetical protein Rhe02_03400 [Rhizocola hellebori]|uniref:Histidine kinase/HSP90-like ATPase domain-containing protein n=1 Tax=Rhizocola hellebori TaxID=1392758 RepID=A0A8J3Q2K3_9ACTN|nr:ATP-binding protein [Rhizocola hellebori]GIH02273.1 hypothetical protein Rhe02_03400 [Rhizocola hellebori]
MSDQSVRRTPLEYTAARICVWLRAGEVVVCAPVALMTAVAPVNQTRLITAVVLFAGWVGCYSWLVLRRGLTTLAVGGDVAVTVLLCLAQKTLVPLQIVDDGSGWVSVVASLCVVSLPVARKPLFAVPAGLTVVAAFGAGFWLAGQPMSKHATLMVFQLAAAVTVMIFVRRAAGHADKAFADMQTAERQAAVEAARRLDARRQLRQVHDTALTTLTLVSAGAVNAGTPSLVRQASADLSAMEEISSAQHPDDWTETRLDLALRRVAAGVPASLTTHVDLAACAAPNWVCDELAAAVAELIRNVAQHAKTTEVWLRLARQGAVVTVTVADRGVGFDAQHVPAQRHGTRESVSGRMREIGGQADLRSAPGQGTTWTLTWPQ